MSETTPEVTETVSEKQQPDNPKIVLPNDHPLVKTLAAQKEEIKGLKEKASRLDQLEESQKSEAEKAAERLAKAEAELAAIPSVVCESLKSHLVKLHDITPEDAELFLTSTDPEILLKQVDRLVGSSVKRGNRVPREGRNPNPSPSDPTRDFLRAINGQFT